MHKSNINRGLIDDNLEREKKSKCSKCSIRCSRRHTVLRKLPGEGLVFARRSSLKQLLKLLGAVTGGGTRRQTVALTGGIIERRAQLVIHRTAVVVRRARRQVLGANATSRSLNRVVCNRTQRTPIASSVYNRTPINTLTRALAS